MYKHGRPTKKVENLKRFARQWEDFTDNTQELSKFSDEDANYVREALRWDDNPMEDFNGMANALQGEV